MRSLEELKAAAKTGYIVMKVQGDLSENYWVALNLETGDVGLDVDPEGALKELLRLVDGR
jgi:hypothetical protein